MSAEERAEIDAYHAALAHDLLQTTHLSMWEAVRRSVEHMPDHPAIVFLDRALTYREMGAAVLRCARQLADRGVGKGTRVALMFHPCPEWTILHYALARLGAVAVPINLGYESAEIAHVLELGKPEMLISVDQFRGADQLRKFRDIDAAFGSGAHGVPAAPELRDVIFLQVDPDASVSRDSAHRAVYGPSDGAQLSPQSGVAGGDPAYILFTSGSTAAPKPALCAHRQYTGGATGIIHALGLRPGDRFLAANPTFHTGGILWDATLLHMAGMTAYMIGAWEPGLALREIERHRITVLGAFDTKMTKMMATPEWGSCDISSLRVANIGATPSFLEKVAKSWPYEFSAQIYGSTESGGMGSITPRPQRDPEVRRQANGMPVPGMEFVILDPETGERIPPGEYGEICFRGWGRFIEYVGQPEQTRASIDGQGFFHSGDYGFMDADGNLYFRGRYKMMIKTGGENVAEREVEIFLENQLEQVRFAQVVGVPDEVWGEAVCAFVELEPGADANAAKLRGGCKGRISGFKIPRHFLFVEDGEWPLLDSGRPDKHRLRERAAASVAADVKESVVQARVDLPGA
ncbi:MAG: acyl--CoA ligase [Proteobacteria bacterium]|nr:acyl--CoA ligase [Pseudomonadota bacterium]